MKIYLKKNPNGSINILKLLDCIDLRVLYDANRKGAAVHDE